MYDVVFVGVQDVAVGPHATDRIGIDLVREPQLR